MSIQEAYKHFDNPFTGSGAKQFMQISELSSVLKVYKEWLRGKEQGFQLSIDKTGKDQGKADLANAYIGFSVTNRNSSTGIYLEDAKRKGIPVNEEINPTRNTVAFVSVAMEGIHIQRTAELAKKILAVGGTVIMDKPGTGFGHSHSSHNKKGEGAVQDILGKPSGQTSQGYNYWGLNPEQRKWILEQINNPASEINKALAEDRQFSVWKEKTGGPLADVLKELVDEKKQKSI